MSKEMEETVEETGLSRRSMIKRVGVGAALVWSAPALLSVNAGASAASPVCTGEGCNWSCGDPAAFCGEPTCLCDSDVDGNCHCLNYNHFCSEYRACNTTADCPAGHYCIPNTCCDTSICAPDCGAPLVAAAGAILSGAKPTG